MVVNPLEAELVDNSCGELGLCLIWQGAVNSKGYASKGNGRGGSELVHRLVWADTCGPIPKGSYVHHQCGNRRCIRLGHLALMTPAEHNRHHTDDPLALRLLEDLADGVPRRTRFLADVEGEPYGHVYRTLRRCAKLGEVEKVAPGTWRIA